MNPYKAKNQYIFLNFAYKELYGIINQVELPKYVNIT